MENRRFLDKDNELLGVSGGDAQPDIMKVVLLTYETIVNGLRDAIKAAGLTEPQWRVLHELKLKTPMIASELACNTFVRASSLSRILRDLEGRDLVVRAQQFEDLRKTLVSITDFGTTTIRRIEGDYAVMLAQLTEDVGLETIQNCVKSCQEIVDALAQPEVQDED